MTRLLLLLALVVTLYVLASAPQTAPDASAPSLETRTAEAYARLAPHAFSVEARGGAFTPAGGGSVPSLPSSAAFPDPRMEAGANQADGSDSGFSSGPSAVSLDLADYALPTPLVGFGGLHPIQETWYRGWAAGIASYMDESYGPPVVCVPISDGFRCSGYLALPIGPGFRVRLCGAGGCAEMTSNDAGPALHMQRQPYNRVADIAVRVWERITGLPRRLGLAQISLTVLGRT